jgi:hypothetical protein
MNNLQFRVRPRRVWQMTFLHRVRRDRKTLEKCPDSELSNVSIEVSDHFSVCVLILSSPRSLVTSQGRIPLVSHDQISRSSERAELHVESDEPMSTVDSGAEKFNDLGRVPWKVCE